eukprot:g29067.t2
MPEDALDEDLAGEEAERQAAVEMREMIVELIVQDEAFREEPSTARRLGEVKELPLRAKAYDDCRASTPPDPKRLNIMTSLAAGTSRAKQHLELLQGDDRSAREKWQNPPKLAGFDVALSKGFWRNEGDVLMYSYSYSRLLKDDQADSLQGLRQLRQLGLEQPGFTEDDIRQVFRLSFDILQTSTSSRSSRKGKRFYQPERSRWFHGEVATGEKKPHLCCKLAKSAWYNRVGWRYKRQANFQLCTEELRPLEPDVCCRVGEDEQQKVGVHIKQAKGLGYQIVREIWEWPDKYFGKSRPIFQLDDVTGGTDYDGSPVSAAIVREFLEKRLQMGLLQAASGRVESSSRGPNGSRQINGFDEI